MFKRIRYEAFWRNTTGYLLKHEVLFYDILEIEIGVDSAWIDS